MYEQDVSERRNLAQLALKGFFTMSARWQLTRPEAMTLLGLTATSTYANWKNGKTGTIPRDTLERIAYLAQIDSHLRKRCPTDTAIIQYLNEPRDRQNEASSLMHRMLQGNVIDLYLAREELLSTPQPSIKQVV